MQLPVWWLKAQPHGRFRKQHHLNSLTISAPHPVIYIHETNVVPFWPPRGLFNLTHPVVNSVMEIACIIISLQSKKHCKKGVTPVCCMQRRESEGAKHAQSLDAWWWWPLAPGFSSVQAKPAFSLKWASSILSTQMCWLRFTGGPRPSIQN